MQHTGFTDAAAALDFIFGGNAVFTLTSSKSGTHFTFKARRKGDDSPFFFSVLNGPDNWENYQYIGYVETSLQEGGVDPFFFSVLNGPDSWENYQYIGYVGTSLQEGGVEQKSCLLAGRKGHPDAPSFKALSWTLAHLNRGTVPADLTIQHEGKCCRCARRLTHPDSIEAGIGPECATKAA